MVNIVLQPDAFVPRIALQLAEVEREGGISPRVSPFVDFRDMGNLLKSANFTLTTGMLLASGLTAVTYGPWAVDVDKITINYSDIFRLIDDLGGMWENNAVFTRRVHLPRDTLFAAGAIYKEMFGNEDGRL